MDSNGMGESPPANASQQQQQAPKPSDSSIPVLQGGAQENSQPIAPPTVPAAKPTAAVAPQPPPPQVQPAVTPSGNEHPTAQSVNKLPPPPQSIMGGLPVNATAPMKPPAMMNAGTFAQSKGVNGAPVREAVTVVASEPSLKAPLTAAQPSPSLLDGGRVTQCQTGGSTSSSPSAAPPIVAALNAAPSVPQSNPNIAVNAKQAHIGGGDPTPPVQAAADTNMSTSLPVQAVSSNIGTSPPAQADHMKQGQQSSQQQIQQQPSQQPPQTLSQKLDESRMSPAGLPQQHQQQQPAASQPRQDPQQASQQQQQQQQQQAPSMAPPRQGPPVQPQPRPPAGLPFRPGPAPPQQLLSNRPGPPMGGGMRELRVEDALLYLDDVKREFGDRPRIYNEFLEIMKNFKSHEVDTPGVIDRVSRLFRGYNKLILGFNKFLPDGYKIRLEDLERKDAEEARKQAAAAAAASQQPYFPGGTAPKLPGAQTQAAHLQFKEGTQPPGAAMQPGFPAKRSPTQAGVPHVAPPPQQPPTPQQQQQEQQQQTQQPLGRGLAQPQQMQMQARGPVQQHQQPPPQHQAVEFDHAISYVTNIKKRFANDPGTYHSFLEILHTYQKEQRGIKEVLEQVASLFADHPDLLKEFTFFLPDAVQEQAKERLHRAAADSEARQAAAARGEEYDQTVDYRGGPQQGSQKFIDMTHRDATPRQRISPSVRKRPFSPRDGAIIQAQPEQPETFVYNTAVERQFFDAAKEALTAYSRDGGQAWAEFVKCLDMYAQDILSRSEMLNFVEPLLGKRNAELFEEFKRILAAAGAQPGPAPSMEDSWHSVPLSEIDFSRCRRCSPSYRALPRDYPAPPCSDRSDEEAKILNDIWVSLPVGSEESYTFRHMRRNQYEETLFRCEDERFEIDMVIDSNAATLRRLEPIAEEIAQLSHEEHISPDLQATGSYAKIGSSTADDTRVGGMGGLRFRYTFDKNILGVIHRNSIARLYGDAGQEMLDLIIKNPTVAVPVVVQRLRQKDREWRAVRDRLNRHWKELAEVNYYKSLDHMSLTWRTTDKRATSTRTLLAEIKDRAANAGSESQATISARLEKAKEEHGSFYEVTMKENLTAKIDLKNLPKPDKTLFTPHLSLMYESDSWAQRDAYRIISFALERGNTSPTDKERCQRLWRDFLGPWFGLSLNWMQLPGISFHPSSSSTEALASIVSNGEISGPEEDDEDSRSGDEGEMGSNVVTEELPAEKYTMGDGNEKAQWMDHHPLPAGTIVSTLFGEGRIKHFRQTDHMYVVSLPFGTAYLLPSAVLCTVLMVEKSAYTTRLRSEDRSRLERPDDMLMIGTQSLYLFFRLHQILIRRLGIAKSLAYKVPNDRSLTTLVEQMRGDDIGRKRYDAYLSLVYALLDGGGHSAEGKYEDRVRCMLGHGAYELATMDKLISHLLKNLQAMGSDETMQQLVELFQRHYKAADGGFFKPDSFRQEAAYLSDGENMFAFQMCKAGGDRRVLYTEFLGVISESDGELGEPSPTEGATSDQLSMDLEPESATVETEPAAKRQRRG